MALLLSSKGQAKPRHLFLFHNLLLICKEKSKGEDDVGYSLKEKIGIETPVSVTSVVHGILNSDNNSFLSSPSTIQRASPSKEARPRSNTEFSRKHMGFQHKEHNPFNNFIRIEIGKKLLIFCTEMPDPTTISNVFTTPPAQWHPLCFVHSAIPSSRSSSLLDQLIPFSTTLNNSNNQFSSTIRNCFSRW